MTGLPDPHHSYAVLIGVAEYQHLENLPAVHNNLTALGAGLRDDRVWGLSRENCVVADGPRTVDEMLDPVAEAAQQATDTLLVYYCGHGLVDPRRSELHLALPGSNPQRIYTSVPYGQVRDVLLDSRASRRIAILDCCYSGRALGQMASPINAIVDEASAEGTYVLAAAAENRTALAPPGARYTAFTGELLAILSNGIGGYGPLLDLDSIFRQLLATLRSKGLPAPQKRDRNTAGQLTLIRNRAFDFRQPEDDPLVLTDTERAITALIVQGLPRQAIASRLGISEEAVAEHSDKISEKLNFSARAQVLATGTAATIADPKALPAQEPVTEGPSTGTGVYALTLPSLGAGLTGGTVTHWLKREGDRVQAGEPLLEMSTSLADIEIPSPLDGVLRGIVVAEDEDIAVGGELALIDQMELPAEAPWRGPHDD